MSHASCSRPLTVRILPTPARRQVFVLSGLQNGMSRALMRFRLQQTKEDTNYPFFATQIEVENMRVAFQSYELGVPLLHQVPQPLHGCWSVHDQCGNLVPPSHASRPPPPTPPVVHERTTRNKCQHQSLSEIVLDATVAHQKLSLMPQWLTKKLPA